MDQHITQQSNHLMAFEPMNEKEIGVIELRNYLMQEGKRDRFIEYFEKYFTHSQNSLGGYILGLFRVQDKPDNVAWIRGFKNMEDRSRFLPTFYGSNYWKEHRANANELILNNDNVYLLKPLGDNLLSSHLIGKKMEMLVADFYIANTRLKELISFFRDHYEPLLRGIVGNNLTAWISETGKNDFPALPVFQDENLLVTLTSFSSEKSYKEYLDSLRSPGNKDTLNSLHSIVTTRHSWILFPTQYSFSKY